MSILFERLKIHDFKAITLNTILDHFEDGACVDLEDWVKGQNYKKDEEQKFIFDVKNEFITTKYFEVDGLDRIKVGYDLFTDSIYFVTKILNNGSSFVLCEPQFEQFLKANNLIDN